MRYQGKGDCRWSITSHVGHVLAQFLRMQTKATDMNDVLFVPIFPAEGPGNAFYVTAHNLWPDFSPIPWLVATGRLNRTTWFMMDNK